MRRVDTAAGNEEFLIGLLHELVEGDDAEWLGIESGRLFRERALEYLLIASVGEFGDTIAGKVVAKNYRVIQDLEERRLWLISPDSPGFDPELEAQFTHLDSAAILVGQNPRYILALGVRHQGGDEELLVVLESLRAAVGYKLRQSAVDDQLHQARGIQMSLLPRELKQLEGFEIAALTTPADEVGGDVYDLQEVEPEVLGFTLADASGHGLPAALQARDVVTGIRMGQARHQKITSLIEQLNRVIHHSGLSSRFISLFYGELEANGNLTYVNCGHCPPLLFRADGSVYELPSTGPVLGPLPGARFRRSFAALRPGDVLVAYTDGITEREAPDQSGEEEDPPVEFGREGLIATCRDRLNLSAEELIRHVAKAVKAFGNDVPLSDDTSLLVIKRLPAQVYSPHEPLPLIGKR